MGSSLLEDDGLSFHPARCSGMLSPRGGRATLSLPPPLKKSKFRPQGLSASEAKKKQNKKKIPKISKCPNACVQAWPQELT